MADGHVALKVHKNFEICIVFLNDLEGFAFVWSLGDRLVGGGLGQKFEFWVMGRRPILNKVVWILSDTLNSPCELDSFEHFCLFETIWFAMILSYWSQSDHVVGDRRSR